MRILLAVADPELAATVEAELGAEPGHLILAQDGTQALAFVGQHPPDLLITAQDLPGIDGLELARLVRLSCRKQFIPILMLTTSTQPEFIRKSLEAGVIEFISFPFTPGELRFRMDTLARFVRLQKSLLEAQAHQDEELALVKHLLEQLSASDKLKASKGFQMETLQTQRINGDACVYRQPLPGIHFGMICDATGHGLMAGVSTIPVVGIFLGMLDRDMPLQAIYHEIHSKLKRLLPTGHFACLLLMRLDGVQGILSVLNAGMPDVLLLKTSGQLQSIPSQVLPAGISGADPGIEVTEVAVYPGDRIFAYSDGLGDLAPPDEIADQYLTALSDRSHPEHCRAIQRLLARTLHGKETQDDLSWALWEVPAPEPLRRVESHQDIGALASGFKATFSLDPRVHAVREVVPHVLSLVMGFRVHHAQARLFGMLLNEALLNAVEHGLLGLDSSMKSEGFEAYEASRKRALLNLPPCAVNFTLTLFHEASDPERRIRSLRAEVEDPGPGFDWRSWIEARPGEDVRPFGRGIALIAGLATDLEFNEAGNRLAFSLECPAGHQHPLL